MTFPDRLPRDRAVVREVIALVLVAAGIAALTVAAFRVDLDLGIAVAGIVTLAAGVYLGLDR